MNLYQLNTFFLTVWPVCCAHTATQHTQQTGQKIKEKSVQLAEVHLYRIQFLQNPYFSHVMCMFKKLSVQLFN